MNYVPYGPLGVIDPATGTKYQAVRIGPEPASASETNLNFVDVGRASINLGVDTVNRGFFYVPAPPPGVRSVTFDAGPFGRIPGVPVR